MLTTTYLQISFGNRDYMMQLIEVHLSMYCFFDIWHTFFFRLSWNLPMLSFIQAIFRTWYKNNVKMPEWAGDNWFTPSHWNTSCFPLPPPLGNNHGIKLPVCRYNFSSSAIWLLGTGSCIGFFAVSADFCQMLVRWWDVFCLVGADFCLLPSLSEYCSFIGVVRDHFHCVVLWGFFFSCDEFVFFFLVEFKT